MLDYVLRRPLVGAAFDGGFVWFPCAQYYIITVASLLVCAYIGASVDNLLLCYLITLLAALYPGLQKHGFVQTVQAKVFDFVGTHLKFLKTKVAGADTAAKKD